MSRYRGKREAPRPERGFGRREDSLPQQDPFLQEEPEDTVEVEAPDAPEEPMETMGDPFAEEGPSGGGKERLKAALGRFGAFWLSRKTDA